MTQDKLPLEVELSNSPEIRSPRRSSTLGPASTTTVVDAAEASSPGTPSSSKSRKPLGPRSPLRAETLPASPSSRRDRAGSSRTSFVTSPIRTSAPASPHSPPKNAASPLLTTAPLRSPVADESAHAPYREPEVVLEEPEQPPNYVPGVVEEHMDDDDMLPPTSPIRVADQSFLKMHVDSWKAEVQPYNGDMDIDGIDDIGLGVVLRPQIGPGVSLRRMLQLVHPHEIFHPDITESLPGSHDQDEKGDGAEGARGKRHDENDVWAAAPGGAGQREEWFFCPTCWAWMRIQRKQGVPEVDDMGVWEARTFGKSVDELDATEDADRQLRMNELTKLALLRESRATAKSGDADHFHSFRRLLNKKKGGRIERISVDDAKWSAWPAVVSDLDELALEMAPNKEAYPTVYMSCTNDTYFIVDEPVAGQIPKGLANRLTEERGQHPRVGGTGHDALEAWELLAKILTNVLFLGETKWLKLESRAMNNKLGQSDTVSLLLYCLGFGCKLDDEGSHRAGPFSKGSQATTATGDGESATKSILSDDELQHMERYMLRTWLEIEMYMRAYRQRNGYWSNHPWDGIVLISPTHLWDNGTPKLNRGYSDSLRRHLEVLGVAKNEVAHAVNSAYKLQCNCDEEHRPMYLSALAAISEDPIVGKEELQMVVMMERSMDRYTLEELQEAYAKIGYTVEHASAIDVEPQDAPTDYILGLHKTAVQAATSSSERQEIFNALKLIGRHRRSDEILELANGGKTLMTVSEAYEALSCPMDAVDDGLIMQYEMAVNEYPGKTDHYRKCLEIIADAPDAERPGIKQFLGTGTLGPPAPPRRDIPVGLQNIGNTCYLNSILQYLYSIKPLRDAVMGFEQDIEAPLVPVKPDVERSKRFVRQLRLLFLQLYGAETSSVRPDEELAYLAITRPEVDAIIEPVPDTIKPEKITLDMIPDMPTPTISATDIGSTRGVSPDIPDLLGEAVDERRQDRAEALDSRSSRSILGKRASQDRDSVGSSNDDRFRLKSESRISESDLVESPFLETAPEASVMPLDRKKQESLGPVSTLADLRLKSTPSSPVLTEDEDARSTYFDAHAEPAATAVPIQAEELKRDDDEFIEYQPPSIPPPLPARPVARRASTLASGLKFGLQQDSAEVLINVLSQLELAFDPPKAEEGSSQRKNIISELFSCTYRQQMFVQSSDGSEERRTPVESVFVHPIIGVEEEGKDLYDCLGELYLSGSEIEYEGKKGYIMDHMERFPPLLYIQMRFDMATGRERKTNTHIPFGQSLVMDRYLSTVDPEKRDKSMHLTREMTRLRTRLHELRDKKPLPMHETFPHLHEALTQFKDQPDFGITDDLLDALRSEGEGIVEEIKGMEQQLQRCKADLEELWAGQREYEYELVSVFMHRGKTSGAGHYWTYQAYLPEHSDRFFKYNDELVTEVPSTEVLEDRTGSDANPALLCYVRKGKDLVHTLHRRILEDSDDISMEAGNKGAEQGEALDTVNTVAAVNTVATVDSVRDNAMSVESAGGDGDMIMDDTSAREKSAPLIEL